MADEANATGQPHGPADMMGDLAHRAWVASQVWWESQVA